MVINISVEQYRLRLGYFGFAMKYSNRQSRLGQAMRFTVCKNVDKSTILLLRGLAPYGITANPSTKSLNFRLTFLATFKAL